ncbi:calcium calmodulin-dependent kinase with a kinase domain and 2 calmodulin-like EF hands [Cryptosporidium sp. chipmunk genotype I]|uniref:calcium calmodulin-dependent kinase with a kinase domain and 2 calmodulin-like EF hands n=1 Tax=Cryptosporidium sp. chipmunk genotype I TaxID=1280935 RepID=UPI003519E2B8|nr:calcium calmodulin-dependent kinase with a kinase domain and 2 calmodulin-like EF hands [Cryptosporidium sp. chipmunk genotype I]
MEKNQGKVRTPVSRQGAKPGSGFRNAQNLHNSERKEASIGFDKFRDGATNSTENTPVRRTSNRKSDQNSSCNRKCQSTESYRTRTRLESSERAKGMCFSPAFKLKFSHNAFVSLGSLLELQKKYHLKGIIGQGSYGVVRVAMENQTGAIRAIKIMNKNKIRQINPKDVERIKTEVRLMKKLHHPNIARLYEVYEDEQYICLVMELCHGGHLLDRLNVSIDDVTGKYTMDVVKTQICPCPECNEEAINGTVKGFKESLDFIQREKLIANTMRQIFSALHYLHNQGICHRDIKPENFLFSTNRSFEIRLVDFGLSKEFYKLNNGEYYGMTTKAGTPYFVAPEVLNSTNESYGPKCDVWSAGILLHLLLMGTVPFPGANDADTISQVLNKKLCFEDPNYNIISPLARDLLSKLLNRNVDERLDAKRALQHPWLSQFSDKIYRVNPIDGVEAHESYSSKRNIFVSTEHTPFQASMLKSLRRYYVSPLLKKIALTVIARYCPDKWIENLRNVFYKLDTRQIGKIKLCDLRVATQQLVAQQKLRVPQHHIDLLLDAVDSDGNGEIDYIEFVAAVISPKLSCRKDVLTMAFKMLDQDEDGLISTKDIKKLVSSEKIRLSSATVLEAEEDSILEDLNVEVNRVIGKGNVSVTGVSFQAFEKLLNTNYEKVCRCYHGPRERDNKGGLPVCGEDSMDTWYDDLLSCNTENENLGQLLVGNEPKGIQKNSLYVCRRTGFRDLLALSHTTGQKDKFQVDINRKRSLGSNQEREVYNTNGAEDEVQGNSEINRQYGLGIVGFIGNGLGVRMGGNTKNPSKVLLCDN